MGFYFCESFYFSKRSLIHIYSKLDIPNYRFFLFSLRYHSNFFLRNIDSAIELARTFKKFSSFFGFKS